MDNELRVKDNLVIEIYLEEIALGNKDSLMKLYNLTRTSVFGFAFSILQNVSDSEDVTQDVYVNIYKYASMYNRMNKPMAWILRITRNLCLEHIRKDKKHSHSSLDDIDKVISVNDSHYDKLFVKTILEELNDVEKQIITLVAIEGYKFHEIATLLDMKLSSVLSKYHRAVKRIRSKYKEAYDE